MVKYRSKSLLGKDSSGLEFNPNVACHSWQELEQYTSSCKACGLSKSRTQVVAGRYSKNKKADLLRSCTKKS